MESILLYCILMISREELKIVFPHMISVRHFTSLHKRSCVFILRDFNADILKGLVQTTFY